MHAVCGERASALRHRKETDVIKPLLDWRGQDGNDYAGQQQRT